MSHMPGTSGIGPDGWLDGRGIANRLRDLLGGMDAIEFTGAAQSLGVTESVIRRALDPNNPQPSISLLAAVVRARGVDPTWLLTGAYDAATHRLALDHDGDLGALVRSLADRRGVPIATDWERQVPPAPEAPHDSV